jgi:hypothetical protein
VTQEVSVIAEAGFRAVMWVDDKVLICVPHHARLAQVWWGAVARKVARRTENLEDFELLLKSGWEARDRDHIVELLAGHSEEGGAWIVEQVHNTEK